MNEKEKGNNGASPKMTPSGSDPSQKTTQSANTGNNGHGSGYREEHVVVRFTRKRARELLACLLVASSLLFIGGYYIGHSGTANNNPKNQKQSPTILDTHAEIKFNEQSHELPMLDGFLVSDDAAMEHEDEVIAISQGPIIAHDSEFSTPFHSLRPKESSRCCRRYSAQLVDFKTMEGAQEFAQRVRAMGVFVEVKKRVGKNADGQRKVWYQVVTPDYENRSELDRVVTKLTKEANITNVFYTMKIVRDTSMEAATDFVELSTQQA